MAEAKPSESHVESDSKIVNGFAPGVRSPIRYSKLFIQSVRPAENPRNGIHSKTDKSDQTNAKVNHPLRFSYRIEQRQLNQRPRTCQAPSERLESANHEPDEPTDQPNRQHTCANE